MNIVGNSIKEHRAIPYMRLRKELDGRTWSRTLPMRCHFCGDTFYGYQAEGEEMPPHLMAPEPELVSIFGTSVSRPAHQRLHCGAVTCGMKSEAEYNRRDEGFMTCCQRSEPSPESPMPSAPQRGLRRASR